MIQKWILVSNANETFKTNWSWKKAKTRNEKEVKTKINFASFAFKWRIIKVIEEAAYSINWIEIENKQLKRSDHIRSKEERIEKMLL